MRRSLATVGMVIATLQVVTACGDTADQDLCTQYAGLQKAADEWQQQDPLTAKAEDLQAEADKFQAELDQVQAVAEGRLDTAITTLREDVDAVRQAAIKDDSGALDTARPLLEDAMDDVAEAWAVVESLANALCD